jgi:hypothetical protein
VVSSKGPKGKKSKKSASGVIEIDLNNVEVREAYDGDDPRPGFYTFELVNAGTHTSQAGAEGFKWIFSLRDDVNYEGWTRTVYSNLDTTKWKTDEIMLALAGGNAVKGTKAAKVRLDMSDEDSVAKYIKKAKLVRGRVQRDRDSDDDDPIFDLGKIIALDEAKMAARKAALKAAEDDDEDEEDTDVDDEFEDADDADEDEEGDDEEDDEDTDEDDEDESDEDEDEDEEDDDEDEEEEPEPPAKKGKKATPAKTASKPASKKAASKVTPITDAKSKKAKRK